MYMLFWGEGRIKCKDFHIYFLHWDPGEKTNLWCSWFQHNHSGFWLGKIEKHLLPSFQILYGAKPFLCHQYQEESWAWVRLEGRRCQGWRSLGCGKGEKWRQTMLWRAMGEQQEMPLTRAALSARETSSRLVSVLIHSLELRGAEQNKAASQHGSGCLGTTAFPAEQGRAGLPLCVGSRAQPTWIWLIWGGFVPTTGGNSCSSPSKSATISHTNHFLSCLSFLKTWFCLFRSSHIKMQ